MCTCCLIELSQIKGKRSERLQFHVRLPARSYYFWGFTVFKKIRIQTAWIKKQKQSHVWKICGHLMCTVEWKSIRWGLVVMLPLWSDLSGHVDQINLFNSDYGLSYWPAQRKSIGVNNGSYCVPIELLQDYKHGARETEAFLFCLGETKTDVVIPQTSEQTCVIKALYN